MLKKISFSLLLLALAGAAVANDTTVITAARLLDVESGEIIAPASVVIEGGRIRAVNPVELPSDATVIDLGDRTLLPGLIDLHTHLVWDLEPDWEIRQVRETAADWSLRGARNAKVTLLAGFTTVRDLWSVRDFPDVALARAIDAGMVEGPRVIPCGHALSITGGHCEITGFAPGIMPEAPEYGVADGVDEVVKSVRYQIKHGAKVIKICATAGVISFEDSMGAQQYTDEEMRAIVEEAARHDMYVAAHAHGTEGIMAATRAGVRSIEHGSILTPEAVRLMKKHGTWLIPNLYLEEPGAVDTSMLAPLIKAKWDAISPMVANSFQLAMKEGVKIAFGTDSGVYPHGDNGKEFAVRVKYGMSPIEAIRGATSYAAEVLGKEDRGVIAEGRLADLIAVDGDPLENISLLEDVSFVMKGGAVYKDPR